MDQGLSRRHFILAGVTAAGGFALGIAMPHTAEALPLAREPRGKSELCPIARAHLPLIGQTPAGAA